MHRHTPSQAGESPHALALREVPQPCNSRYARFAAGRAPLSSLDVALLVGLPLSIYLLLLRIDVGPQYLVEEDLVVLRSLLFEPGNDVAVETKADLLLWPEISGDHRLPYRISLFLEVD